MDTRYPTTPLEQLVLRAVQSLDGAGDKQAIWHKVCETDNDIEFPRLAKAVDRLENLGYISYCWSEAGEPKRNPPPLKKLYRIEIFGERALTAPPLNRFPSPATLQKRVILAFVLFAFENLNAMTWKVASLDWPIRIAVYVAAVWVLIGAYQLRRAGRQLAEWESRKPDERN